jgi:hypothetical protein
VKVNKTIVDLLELTREVGHTLIINKVKSVELNNKLDETTKAYFITSL